MCVCVFFLIYTDDNDNEALALKVLSQALVRNDGINYVYEEYEVIMGGDMLQCCIS